MQTHVFSQMKIEVLRLLTVAFILIYLASMITEVILLNVYQKHK